MTQRRPLVIIAGQVQELPANDAISAIAPIDTTRAALVALAGGSGLLPGQIYLLTDENRIAIALTASTFETYAKQAEAGGGGGASPIISWAI